MQIQQEFKKFGIQFPKNQNVTAAYVRSKEFLNQSKNQLLN